MQPEGVTGRRLRFPIDMHDRESIPGAIARGVREQVMVRTAPVLAAANVRMKHIGYSQIATRDELQRLAYVARVPARKFLDRAGQRLQEKSGGKSMETRFGSLVMPRAFLELEGRRIGPLSVDRAHYHRLSWMNLLLPYCPESLERLVDTCGECGTRLGWRYAVGLASCDLCDAEIKASSAPPLPDDLAEEYRLFADLSSPDTIRVDDALERMPEALRHIGAGQLVRLSLLLGGLVHDAPDAFSRNRVTDLPPATLALVATAGTALLRSWPQGLRDWVAERTEHLRDRPEVIERLRSRLQRIVDRQMETGDIVDVVSTALPDLRQHAAHGFSHGRSYYLYKGVQNLLGLSSPRMEALKSWKGIKFRRLNTAVGKEQGQFDVEQIDGLVPAFRDAVDLNACTGLFRLPLYAIEQLSGAKVLEWENNQALLATGGRDKVRGASVRHLVERLNGGRKEGRTPADCVSLSSGSKLIGGRFKPWAAMLDALVSGRVPYWLRDGHPSTATIMIRASDLGRFSTVVDPEPPAGLTTSSHINQKDSAEVLNATTASLMALSGRYALPFEQQGMGLATSRERVLEVAAEIAWAGEICHHLQLHPTKVARVLSGLGTRTIQSGWCRRHLVDQGILPRGPEA